MGKLQGQSRNIVYLLLVLVAVALLSRNPFQFGDDGSEDCRKHLKATATQIEVFSIDYQGRIPKDWSEIIPDYLKETPKCPVDKLTSYQLDRNKPKLEGVHEGFQYYKIRCSSPRHNRVLTYDNIKGEG